MAPGGRHVSADVLSDKHGQADAGVAGGWTPGSMVTSPASRVWGNLDGDSRDNHDAACPEPVALTSFFRLFQWLCEVLILRIKSLSA